MIWDSMLKQYGAIAYRFDKTARNFLGAIPLVACIVLLGVFKPQVQQG
jgi:hypothetical protein